MLIIKLFLIMVDNLDDIDKILTNLKIISKIQQNNKFYMNKENFIIVETNNIIFSLYRLYNNIDRYKNIEDLIKIYNEIFLVLTKLLNYNGDFYKYYLEFDNNINKKENINNKDNKEYKDNKDKWSKANNKHLKKDDNDESKTICKKIIGLKSGLINSIKGLNNLKIIYQHDVLVDSKIDIIINNINNNIILIKEKVENSLLI